MPKKLSLSQIKLRFEQQGCILLAESFINAKTLMPYVCSCGNKALINLNNFTSGSRCMLCSGSTRYKYTYTYVEKFFEQQGCILLSTEYKNADQPLEYVCVCGNISTTRFGNFHTQFTLCNACAPQRIGQKNITHGKYSLFQNNIIPHESVISYTSQQVTFYCTCGKVETRTYNGPSLTKQKLCWSCLSLRRLNSLARGCHDYRLWRTAVLLRDNEECIRCSSDSSLNAHHIEPWSKNKELRFEVSNGITFCYHCHREFHRLYGLDACLPELTRFIMDEHHIDEDATLVL